MTKIRREILTRWAATKGVDTALFQQQEEWDLLEAAAEFHVAVMMEQKNKDRIA